MVQYKRQQQKRSRKVWSDVNSLRDGFVVVENCLKTDTAVEKRRYVILIRTAWRKDGTREC